MLRMLYRVLCIAIICVLAWGSHGVQAQSSDNVCVTKNDWYPEFQFTPDSQYLVASWDNKNGTAKLWSVATGKVIRTFTHTVLNMREYQGLGRFAFSSDGKYLLALHSNTPDVVLWDTQTGQMLYDILPDGEIYSEGVDDLYISPDDQRFFMRGDYSLRVYNFKTGKQLHRFLNVEARAWFDWSKDYKNILMWEVREIAENGVTLLNIDTNKKLWSLNEKVWNAQFISDDKYIAVALWGNPEYSFTLWDASTYQPIQSINLGDNVREMALSSDGKHLLIINEASSVMYDTLRGKQLHTFISPQYPLRISPDSRYVLFAVIDQQNPDHEVYRLWDIKQNHEKPNIQIDNVYPIDPSFSPNGQYLLVGVYLPDRSFGYHLWDINLNREIPNVQIDESDTIKFSPNSKFIATASSKGQLRLWNIETGDEMHLDC